MFATAARLIKKIPMPTPDSEFDIVIVTIINDSTGLPNSSPVPWCMWKNAPKPESQLTWQQLHNMAVQIMDVANRMSEIERNNMNQRANRENDPDS